MKARKKQHTKLVCHATLKLSSPKSRNVKKKRKSFIFAFPQQREKVKRNWKLWLVKASEEERKALKLFK